MPSSAVNGPARPANVRFHRIHRICNRICDPNEPRAPIAESPGESPHATRTAATAAATAAAAATERWQRLELAVVNLNLIARSFIRESAGLALDARGRGNYGVGWGGGGGGGGEGMNIYGKPGSV